MEDNATPQPEITELRDEPDVTEHQLVEVSEDTPGFESNVVSQLRRRIYEAETAFRKSEELRRALTESNLDLQRQLKAAHIANQNPSEGEAKLRQDYARLVERVKIAEGAAAKLGDQVEKYRAVIPKYNQLVAQLQQKLKESEARYQAVRGDGQQTNSEPVNAAQMNHHVGSFEQERSGERFHA